MASIDTFICKCGQWNRSPAPNFGRLICCNCGSPIVSVAPNASRATLRGQPIGPARTVPPPATQQQPKPVVPQSSDAIPVGIILTLILAVGGGLFAALSPKQPPPPNIVLKAPAIEKYVPAQRIEPVPPVTMPPVTAIPISPIPPVTFCYKDKHGRQHCPTPPATPAPPTTPPLALPIPAPPQSSPIAPPNTGVIQGGFHKRKLRAPFTIDTQSGTDYLIKLVKTTDAKNRIMIYVRGGQTYRDSVPLGSYRIRAASGTTWYGKDHLFGPSTQFFRFQQKGSTGPDGAVVLNFKQQGNQLLGVTLSLKNVVDGNMQQQTISRQEFDQD